MVNGALADDVRVGGAPAPQYFQHELGPDSQLDFYHAFGSFIVSEASLGDGHNEGTFELPSAEPGDEVLVTLEVVATPDPANHTAQASYFTSSSLFDLPRTPSTARVSNTVKILVVSPHHGANGSP